MEQPFSRLAYLFNRYTTGTCSDEEREEYLAMVRMDQYVAGLQQLIEQEVQEGEAADSLTAEERNRILNAIMQQQTTPVISMQPRKARRFIWWSAAAVLVLLVTTVSLWQHRQPERGAAGTIVAKHQDVPPGASKAVLTLADGTQITLDTAANGKLAQQGGAVISQTGNGQLIYSSTGSQQQSAALYNTLATPRGGQYQLVLPDGSRVWLNAASSIRYPAVFAGKERKVEITGEAYFEVEKNPAMPFIVQANNMEVRVLGTHFNINAYSDEATTRTTLLQGSVAVKKEAATAQLYPGQQASISATQTVFQIKTVDTDAAVAWKNGYFSFKDAGLQEIMRQASKWYDVEVVFEGKVPEVQFSGEIGRGLTLNQFLSILEQTRIPYKITDKKLIFSP